MSANHASPASSGGTVPNEDHHSEPKRVASCERCRTRKLKCDRQWPSCQRCGSAQVACKYSHRRKPGFPAGERQSLEDKISRLEAEVGRARESTREAREPTLPASYAPNVEMSNTAARDVLSQAPLTHSDRESPPLPTLEKTRWVVEREPPADLLFALTALFFRHVHPWFPFLDAQRVFADMESAKNTPLLYFVLFGVSIPYSCDSRLDNRASDSFWTYSKRRIFVDILEEPSLTSLEALAVLTLDLSGMTNGPQVWGALSIAVKFSVQLKPVGNRVLRMSAEKGAESTLNTAEQIRRTRLFWAIFALDSYITITTSLPSDLSDDHIGFFLPTRCATWRRPQVPAQASINQGSEDGLDIEREFFNAAPTFIFYFQLELLDISRKIHKLHIQRHLNPAEADAFHWMQNLASCSTELANWLQALPRCLLPFNERNKRSKFTASPPSLIMLHTYYYALLIHLHGLAAYMNMAQQSKESQETCMYGVDSITKVVSTLDKSACEKLGWPFAWSIWVACRYLLTRSHNEGVNLLGSFYVLIECLKSLSKYCQIGGKYLRLLKQAAAEFEAQARSDEHIVSSHTLLTITDLRIPTSDLEDQARPDPVNHAAAAEGANVNVDEMNLNFGFDSQAMPFNDPIFDNGFGIPEMASDNWFTASLFPSSRYQQ